jgi:hypothetical protein
MTAYILVFFALAACARGLYLAERRGAMRAMTAAIRCELQERRRALQEMNRQADELLDTMDALTRRKERDTSSVGCADSFPSRGSLTGKEENADV